MRAFTPSLFDRSGFYAVHELNKPWRASGHVSTRPVPRAGYRFVGPFKTLEAAQTYCGGQNVADGWRAKA